VKLQPLIVLFVLVLEPQLHLVHVQLTISPKLITLVLLVIIGVLNVNLYLPIVLFVQLTLTDLPYHVSAMIGSMITVLLFVNNVALNVLLVITQMVVLLVLKEELTHQIVLALKENSLMPITSVNLVHITVPPVKHLTTIV